MGEEKRLKSGWRVWRFEQMAVNVKTKIDDPSKADVDYYVGLEHLDPDSLKIRRWGHPSDVEAQKLCFKKGDIIFGKRRVYQRKLGVAEWDGICSAHAFVLRAKPDVVLPEFLPFFMQSDLFMERAQAISVGSLSPTINWKTLAKEEFALPSLEEQRVITKLLFKIDDFKNKLINFNYTTNLLYQSFREKKIEEWLKGEKNIYKVKNICNKIVDGTHKTPTYIEAGIPFLRVTDINSEEIDWSNVKYISPGEHLILCKRCKPEKGDVLLSKNGTIGITKVIDWEDEFSIFVSLCLLKPKSGINPYFLSESLNSIYANSQLLVRIKEGTVKNLHLEEIRECSIPVPESREQNELVEKIQVLKAISKKILARITYLQKLKQAVLN